MMNGAQIAEHRVKPQDFTKRVALRRTIPQVTPAVWSGAQGALGREDLLEVVEVGDLQTRMLKVVEEQALYILQLEEKQVAMEEKQAAMEQRIRALEASQH